MKVVAASKLRKARMAAEETRLFTNATRSSFLHSLSSLDNSDNIGLDFMHTKDAKKTLLVLVSGDRGLCGGINNNIIKYTIASANKIISDGRECKIAIIGKKATDGIASRFPNLVFSTSEGFSSRKIDLEAVNNIKAKILSSINDEGFNRVRIIYSGFESAISQVVVDKLFIASKEDLLAELAEETKDQSQNDLVEFEYEPSKEQVILSLFDYYVLSTLNQAFFESYASEQGARMTAMDNAVNNCSELVNKLTLVYNRTRQAKITTELVELISAVESI